MTDRRARHFLGRVRRSTIGRVFPFIRHLHARGVWDWWTATGVIPRWQLLLVYMLVVAAGALGIQSNRSAVDRINTERQRNAVAACARDSTQNQALLDFMAELGARAETLKVAARFFPTPTPAECERRVQQTVDS